MTDERNIQDRATSVLEPLDSLRRLEDSEELQELQKAAEDALVNGLPQDRLPELDDKFEAARKRHRMTVGHGPRIEKTRSELFRALQIQAPE